MVDGGITTLVHDDGRKEEFGGLVLRLHHRLLTVSLLGRRGPNPRRWRPRLLARRLWCRAWWTITRRPPPLPSASGHDFCPEADE